ncbi:MAG: 50S ribosomal protein L10 [Gaiellaceae bacterium]|jgi:large subunit ribosomal protein L10
MDKSQKEQVVAELTERLRASETLIVADYRGLTMPQVDRLRTELLTHGAKFQVVKNTLTRRAAEAAGADHLLALLEGPTAIAFLETDGDAVAVAKALRTAARETQVIEIRGGVIQGRTMSAEEVTTLATLPSLDVLRGQVLGAVTAPLMTILALFNAPLQNLVGLIDARIEQLEAQGDTSAAEAPAAEPEAVADETPEPDAEAETPAAEADGEPPAAEATTETTTEEEGEDQ